MSARMSREAAAQMHEFAVKAILATGVPMPQTGKKHTSEFVALARSLFPSTRNNSIAAKKLTKLLIGKIRFTPGLSDYEHACSVLGIAPEAMTPPASSRAIVARVSNKKQKKNKQLNSNHLGYSQCCARFRRKVFCALNELGIPVPLPGEKPHEKFREFLRYTAPTSGNRARLLAFFNQGRPIDPSIALYWRLCHELGIDPDGSGFVYELKESVDIEAL